MCAVIGAVILSPQQEHFDMLKRVFHESRIRGMHATGLSYVKNGEVVTTKSPVPADQFPFDFPSYVNEDGNLYLIGHCRYSTSDLEFNQPIANETLSVVHNGVVSQELPEHWKELYGFNCKTKNDTELILETVLAGESPLKRWKDASLAVCELSAEKKLRVYRNGKRPMYLTVLDEGCIITSTADVAKRANLNYTTVPLSMNIYHTIDSELTHELEKVDIAGAVDYQL